VSRFRNRSSAALTLLFALAALARNPGKSQRLLARGRGADFDYSTRRVKSQSGKEHQSA
jgi:hypothetical protein